MARTLRALSLLLVTALHSCYNLSGLTPSGNGGGDGGAATPCASSSYVCFEAESGVLVAPMVADSDPTASGGQYVETTMANQGSVAWTFQIATAGTYIVWCRVIAADDGTDSFFAAIDGGDAIEYDTSWVHMAFNFQPTWQWTPVNSGADETMNATRMFDLAAGSHTLAFTGREAGSKVDRLIVTSDASFVPSM